MTTPQNSGGSMDFAKLFSAMTAIFKAVPQDKLADLNDLVDHAGAASIVDLWNENEHSMPSRAELGTGPSVSMRGGGVTAQIARSSDFAAQSGLVEMYERFDNMLAGFGKSVNAALKAQDQRVASLAGVVSDMAKANASFEAALKSAVAQQQTAVKAPDGTTYFGKAQIKLANAQKAFRKAEMDEDEDEREERKSKLSDIALTLKSILKLITKAEDEEASEEDDVEKAVTAVKSLQRRVASALASITKAEEEEKEEEAKKAATKKAEEEKEKEEEAKKAAATKKAEEEKEKEEEAKKAALALAAKKAEGADEGTERFTEEEKKDDTAKAQIQDMLTKALNGQATLEATLKSVMDTLSSVSRVQPALTMQPVVKGAPLATLEASVRAGMDNLDQTEAMEASTLIQRHHMAAAGHYPAERLAADIAGAASNVRNLFAQAA